MQSIVLILIVFVDFARSSRVISEMDGLCQCANIDGTRYESEEFRNEARYRIWNGTIVRPPDLRWAAMIYQRTCGNATERLACETLEQYHYKMVCSGVLISYRFVLTVGHVWRLRVSFPSHLYCRFKGILENLHFSQSNCNSMVIQMIQLINSLIHSFKFKCLEQFNSSALRNVSLFVSVGHDVRTSFLSPDHFRRVKNYTFVSWGDFGDFGILQLESPFVLGNETGIYPACLLNRTCSTAAFDCFKVVCFLSMFCF